MRPEIEDIVYLKTDPEQLPRMILGYTVRKNSISWELGVGATSSWHYDFEFVSSKDELNKPIGFKDANA